MGFKELTEDELRTMDVTTLRRMRQEQQGFVDQAKVIQTKAETNVTLIERVIDLKNGAYR